MPFCDSKVKILIEYRAGKMFFIFYIYMYKGINTRYIIILRYKHQFEKIIFLERFACA